MGNETIIAHGDANWSTSICKLNATLHNLTSINWSLTTEHETEYNLVMELFTYIIDNPIQLIIVLCIIWYIIYRVFTPKKESNIIVDEKSLNEQRNWEIIKNEKT